MLHAWRIVLFFFLPADHIASLRRDVRPGNAILSRSLVSCPRCIDFKGAKCRGVTGITPRSRRRNPRGDARARDLVDLPKLDREKLAFSPHALLDRSGHL